MYICILCQQVYFRMLTNLLQMFGYMTPARTWDSSSNRWYVRTYVLATVLLHMLSKYTYDHMYVHIYVCTYICTYVRTFAYIYVHM